MGRLLWLHLLKCYYIGQERVTVNIKHAISQFEYTLQTTEAGGVIYNSKSPRNIGFLTIGHRQRLHDFDR